MLFQKKATYLLTGDIGGTNSRMSFYDAGADCSEDTPLVVKYFRNADHLPEEVRGDPAAFQKYIIKPFLKHCWEEAPNKLVARDNCQIVCCLAIAGIVSNNSVILTNLGNLSVDGSSVQEDIEEIVSCRIINDFVAQGYGCLTLKPHEVKVLAGPKTAEQVIKLPVGPKVCVGAGTGLGECYLTPDDDGVYTCFPSEGGHVEYAPRTEAECELWHALKVKFGSTSRVSVERVVSGVGLANVYEALAAQSPDQVEKSVHDEFLAASDQKGRVVAVNATKKGSLCEKAMHMMVSAYGCEVGSAAIKWVPTGGLFVTGGLTPKNINFIAGPNSHFLAAYHDKGRVSTLLERVPLFAVLVEDLGVRGAHKAAQVEYDRFVLTHHPHLEETGGNINTNYTTFTTPASKTLIVAATAAISFAIGIAVSRTRRLG